jgi:DNA modification methylase
VSVRFLIGDARSRLKELPDESVHCCVTSPPYFGLRDYGTAQWDGGDPACDHRAPSRFDYALNSGLGPTGVQTQGSNAGSGTVQQFRSVCGKCGARRIDSQIGLEESPAAYVAELVAVFREVRRVLRSDGTVFLNIGDSYAQNEIRHRQGDTGSTLRNGNCKADEAWAAGTARTGRKLNHGLKPKDLIGVPWRLAFALQEDGWWLRQDIIWSKPNPMPESVTDRCTKSHEYVFLLTKSASYAYDAQAIAEPSAVSVEDWKPARGQNRNNASTTLRNDGDRHGGGQLGRPGTGTAARFGRSRRLRFPRRISQHSRRSYPSFASARGRASAAAARIAGRGGRGWSSAARQLATDQLQADGERLREVIMHR